MEQNNSFIMKPKVDFCFKELMASAAIRQGFIAAVLGVPPEEIRQTELLPAHLRQKYAEDKLGILDVRVILKKTVQICRRRVSGHTAFKMGKVHSCREKGGI